MRRMPIPTLGLLVVAATAAAQEVDLTYTQPPVVMLAIDTSGSMQWRGTGIRRDDRAGIKCELGADEKSREIVVKEVLTGTFNGYSLRTIRKNTNSSLNPLACTVGEHAPQFTSQESDGLLDAYRERIRFALSSFDSVEGNRNNGALVSGQPDWSYPGTTDPAPVDGRVYRYCGSTSSSCSGCSCVGTCQRFTGTYDGYYCLGNVGVRSESGNPCTGAGCLVSAGTPGSAIGPANDALQDRILQLKSVGNTPIAAMLKDIRWWFDNHPDVKIDSRSPPLVACRRYFTLLVTDGAPNQNCGYSNLSRTRPEVCFRFGDCTVNSDCPGSGTGEWSCVSGACEHKDFLEPDVAAEQRAADLLNPPGGGKSIPVHVIGFNLPSAATCVDNADCAFGQTCTTVSANEKRCSCATDANCDSGETCEDTGAGYKECRLGGKVRSIASAGGGQAAFASDPASLRAAMNQILSGLMPETTSRTRPTSTAAIASLNELPSRFPEPQAEALFLFQGAFNIPPGSIHWKGFLQRVTIGNVGTAESPIIGPIQHATGRHGTIRFDELLNTQPNPVDDQGIAYTRKIYTYKSGRIVEFTKANITRFDLGVTSDAERDRVVDFVRGEVGSERANNRLGAIYHSSPVVLEPPVLELAMPSYQAYKQDPRIRARPPMVFVGSNLGMLHAFNGQTGKEEWAYIPPILLKTLKNQLQGFTWGVDVTPVARDIQLSTVNETADPKGLRNWRAVVAFGIGYAAYAHIALDVTDPVYRANNDPPFSVLWQFDDQTANPQDKLGIPFGSPELGTVFLDDAAAGYPFQERAVAILPGGKKPQGQGIGGNRGEDIWVLNLETGAILRRLDGTPGGGGMTGTCAAVDDFPGSFITRAYCGDNKGKFSRVNLADPVIANWTSTPEFYDLYQGATGGVQQPIFAAPTLAYRSNGNLMILGGNGDPYDLQSTDPSRFAFVEEVPTFDAVTGVLTGLTAVTRKLLIFENGEKVTGSPVIFNHVAYFTTFIPDVSSTCSFGRTRLWGVAFDQFRDPAPTCNVPNSGVATACGFVPKLESQCGPDLEIDTSDDTAGITESCKLPLGSVSFGFDLVRTPSAQQFAQTGTSSGGGGSATSGARAGGELKLVFQTGSAVIGETSKLRDPQLTPPGAQTIQVGALNLPDVTARTRILSWGRVLPF